MAKHRRHEADVLLAVRQYQQLVQTLHTHRPDARSGLCLVCGIGWPLCRSLAAAGTQAHER
jgi:hypothetical protein